MPKKKPRCLKWAKKKTKGKRRCVRRATSVGRTRLVGLGADFSRKHYTAVAKMLCQGKASKRVIDSFADYFAADNPGFKRTLFVKAAKRC